MQEANELAALQDSEACRAAQVMSHYQQFKTVIFIKKNHLIFYKLQR